jgi:Tol biopolymer transport system component
VVGLPSAPSGPNTATALAVSVLSDSIYLVDPGTGSQETLVTGLTDFQGGFATWAPDHRHLAYGSAGVIILDAASDKGRTLRAGQMLSMPTWSSDGKQVAYGDGTHLWVTPATKASPVMVTLPTSLAPIAMDWGKKGAIAFEGLQVDCNVPGPCQSTNQSDVWTIRPDRTNLTQLTHVGSAINPKWSPDASQILFIRQVKLKKTTVSQIWAVRSNGTGLHRLTSATGVLAADWSPDGKEIAMIRTGTLPNTMQVWFANSDGSNLHALAGEILPGVDATLDW